MIRGKPLYIFIPARGGSKGIPGKNLYVLKGKTLLQRAIDLAKECKWADQVYVSTDHGEMFEIAKKNGVATPHLRPANLATDSARTADVLLHHLEELKLNDGYVLLLQVTTPLRTSKDLESFLKNFENTIDQGFDSSLSLSPQVSPHPYKVQTIQDGEVKPLLKSDPSVPRQELPEVYALNGAFYLTSIPLLQKRRSLLGDKVAPFVMPPERSVNCDSPLDLLLVEALVEKGLVDL